MIGVAATLLLSACGGEDFENEPRPAVPLQLSGVITDRDVTVSPDDFGAGPVVLTISNQTSRSHRVALESQDGGDVSEITAPINPQDAATIQQSLPPGEYTVSANSDGPRLNGIAPARISVGPPRKSGSDELELP